MREFIIKVVTYVLIVCGITVATNVLYCRNDSRFPELEPYKTMPEKFEYCAFGSSHAYHGYNFDGIKEEHACFNFGLAGQSFIYDLNLLKTYIDHIDSNTKVFITVSYFSLFGLSDEKLPSFKQKNTRYYFILPDERIINYNAWIDFYETKTPSLIAYEKLPITLCGGVKDSGARNNINNNTVDMLEDIAAYNYNVVTDHIFKNKIDLYGKRIINNEEINALLEMVNLCKKQGADCVLVTTPYLREYIEGIEERAPEFFKDFENVMDKVIGDSKIPYYDYSHDQRFIDDHKSFSDTDHLNANGGRRFMDILMEEVEFGDSYRRLRHAF